MLGSQLLHHECGEAKHASDQRHHYAHMAEAQVRRLDQPVNQ